MRLSNQYIARTSEAKPGPAADVQPVRLATLAPPDLKVQVEAPGPNPKRQAAPAHLATQSAGIRTAVFGVIAGAALLLGGCATNGGPLRVEDPAPVERLVPGIVQRSPHVKALSPDLQGTPEGIVEGAYLLIDQYSANYKESGAWWNLDPDHPLPTEVSLGGMAGQSKCNLFALQTVVLGGFEPPRYGNGSTGEYANANQMWKWGDSAAVTFGNPVRFETVAEAPLDGASRKAKLQRIRDVLLQAQPGDLVLDDHGPKANGERVVNRGHARVVVNNPLMQGGDVIEIAHATDMRGAVVEREAMSEFAREHHIWVLRPKSVRGGEMVVKPEPAPPENAG